MKHISEKPGDKKARLKIQRRLKSPVFILMAFLSFSVWTLQTDEEASGTQFNVSLVSFALLLVLYYKMLTDSLNWVYRQLQEENIKDDHKPTRLSNFIIYGIATLLPTIVYAGLFLFVFRVLLS